MNNFECKACGKCCKGDGSVFLFPDDIFVIAKNLGIDVQKFVDNYTNYIMLELIEDEGTYFYVPYLVLKKNEENQCLFLKENKCSIHNFKPIQCRKTPFVPEFFSDIEWQKDICSRCEGLKCLDNCDIENYYKNQDNEIEEIEKLYQIQLEDNRFNLEKILGVILPAPEIIQFEDED